MKKYTLVHPPKNVTLIPFVWSLLKNLEVTAEVVNEKIIVKVESLTEALRAQKTIWHENVTTFLQKTPNQDFEF